MRSLAAAAVLLASSAAQAQVGAIGRLLPRVRAPARASVVRAIEASRDPLLVLSVIQAESGGDPSAESPIGARGLMQLVPATFEGEARALGLRGARIDRPADNVAAGARYLERMVDMFGRTDLGLMAYAWGPGRLRAAGGRAPRGVREYAARALRRRLELAAQLARGTCVVAIPPVCWKAPVCR